MPSKSIRISERTLLEVKLNVSVKTFVKKSLLSYTLFPSFCEIVSSKVSTFEYTFVTRKTYI